MEFYLDTSIWLDIYEKRGKNGEFGLQLINKITKNNDLVYFSDLTIIELKKLGYTKEEIASILLVVNPFNRRKIHFFKEQNAEADRMSKRRRIPKGDVIHAILARDNDLILVSRDQHFEKLVDLCPFFKPEEFI